MKKIINGKKYDTETATRLADWNNGGYCKETLYQKHTGEYFIYGLYDTRSDISPLTEPEARVWVEECANDKYEAIFGEVEE